MACLSNYFVCFQFVSKYIAEIDPTHEPLWRRIVVFCTVEDGLYCYVLRTN